MARENIAAKAILCDIEGTTTSIQYVKDTLFPFSVEHAEKYITANWDRNETQDAVNALIQQAKVDIKNNIEGIVPISEEETNKDKIIEAVVKNFRIQVKNDLKVAPVKNLQGLIWQEGYKSGSVKGHIYDDIPRAFSNWQNNGVKLYIYSSGSVHAQKLLYGSSESGDLLPYIAGHFDTKVGMKQETKSYENILNEIKCNGSDVVFFTDIPKEAYAAKAAGIRAILLDRPGNAPLSQEDRAVFKVIKTFDEVNIKLPE
ncbi:enolase-phosphatase E1 [Hermetia illucens]|uniref:enolase-phosphatase E1 n=1 Tax=Hermetia illucens TaxID=343691 RepID=UPI0018CC5179|nr:enolase-phosphatase E1 [Hermetia illucens]XP_037903130.1 enolase-phosphatase E1 [Hermetia illucens]